MRRLTLVSLVLAVLSLAACKSGLDERCQVNADCEDGLVCVRLSSDPNNPVSVCREGLDNTADAAIDAPQDGPEADAAPDLDASDAAIDAGVDAETDASSGA